jgi:predicted AlkP superfamily phosphohydrolase/phosphomutase
MSKKVLIIGLDGATFDVLNPLVEEGIIPNIASLIEQGAYGPMTSTVPPISGPAWLSLATGMKPDRTAIYDFSYKREDSYRLQGITSEDFQGRAVWDYLSAKEKRVGILNYPLCMPPYEVNGFLTAGIGTSSDRQFTFPASLKKEINDVAGGDYELLVPYHDARYDDTELFLSDLQKVLNKQVKVATHLLKNKRWDLFWLVISATDWLQHIMWHHIDENHPLNQGDNSKKMYVRFKEIWGEIDQAIGEFKDIAGQDTNLVIISDHGFGTNDQVFKLNAWLEREGYLERRGRLSRISHIAKNRIYSSARTIARGMRLHWFLSDLYERGRKAKSVLSSGALGQIELEKSVAFDPGHTIPFGGIYINDNIIKSAVERQKLAVEIADKLRDWGEEHNLEFDIRSPNRSDDTMLCDHPDLIVGVNNYRCVVLKDQFKGELFEERPFSQRHTGSHRMNGIFIAAGPDISTHRIEGITVYDIAPTILYLFDEPIPVKMDGKVLESIVDSEYLVQHPTKQARNESSGKDVKHTGTNNGPKEITDEDKELLKKQLRDLGYM